MGSLTTAVHSSRRTPSFTPQTIWITEGETRGIGGTKDRLADKKVGGESNSFTSRGGVMHDKRLEGCSSSPCQARLQPHSLTAVTVRQEAHRPKACRYGVFSICNGLCQRLRARQSRVLLAAVQTKTRGTTGLDAPKFSIRFHSRVARVRYRPKISLIFPASLKSSSLMPPTLWVLRSITTLFHTLNHSGW